MSTTAVNGVELYYEESGDGEPIILVHGAWGDHTSWSPLVPLLDGRHRVIAYDRRGHSRSGQAPTGSTLADDIDDLAGLISLVVGTPVHVVGNSIGASIALRLAAQRPDLVRSASAHEPPLYELLTNADDNVSGELRSHSSAVDEVLALLDRGENEAGARMFIETIAIGPGAWDAAPPAERQKWVRNAPTFLEERRDPTVSSIDLASLSACPVALQLTYGTDPTGAFRQVARAVALALAEHLPNAQLRELRDAGHAPARTHPDLLAGALLDFIANAGT